MTMLLEETRTAPAAPDTATDADAFVAPVWADEARRRAEFPVAAVGKAFLAHAAVAPPPTAVAEAVAAYAAAAARTGQFEHLHRPAEESVRRLAAKMIGATDREIAIVPSTSAGLAMVAEGLPWKAGEAVLVPAGDFPANLHPWLALRRLGVRVDFLRRHGPGQETGPVTADEVEAALTPETRLVALSAVHYVTGDRIDVDAIGAMLHRRGVLFCVDGIQALGAVGCPARHVDFLVADAHKWLLGPQGTGVLFVRAEAFPLLRPVLVGWRSVQAHQRFAEPDDRLADTARRYEPGSLNTFGVVGLAAALELLDRAGPPTIEVRISMLRKRLVAGLLERGASLVGEAFPRRPSGIVSFIPRTGDPAVVGRMLDARGVVVSVREHAGRKVLRAAPHFYNTEEDIARLLAMV